jgi:peptidoglycan hydrolase CwlO-like protein
MPTPEQDQRDTNRDTKYELDGLHKDIATLEKTIKTNMESFNKALESLQKDRESAMRWGIIVLGGAVLSMGTWIFNLVSQVHK